MPVELDTKAPCPFAGFSKLGGWRKRRGFAMVFLEFSSGDG